MYTDPNGEYFGIDDVIAMLIGGIVNSVSQCISGNVHNVGQFFSYFGVGAVAGEISIYASPVVGGMFLGGSNAVVTGAFSPDGISGMDIASGITIGGISAGAGSALSSAIAGPMSSLTSSWGNQVLSKAVTNVTASTASGFIVGTGFALGCGADWRTALSEGGKGAALGFTAGTISSVGYSVSLYKNGFNPWTGNRVTCPDSDLMPMNALVEPQNLGNSRAPTIGRKLDYMYGKATGTDHNVKRSIAMKKQLESIGLFDNNNNRSYIESEIVKSYQIDAPIPAKEGTFMRETILMGPNGGLLMQTLWNGDHLNTIYLIGGH